MHNLEPQVMDLLRTELAKSPIAAEWQAAMAACARILDAIVLAIEHGTAGDTPAEIADFVARTADKARSIVEHYGTNSSN